MDEAKKNSIIKAVVLMILGAIVVVAAFVIITRGGSSSNTTTEDQELTEVQKITTIDLSKNYPASPVTVADMYIRVMQVLYKQDYTDEEFNKMTDILKGIFDTELLANQTNWPSAIKTDVDQKKEGDYSITKYQVLSSDIQDTTEAGEEISNVLAKLSLRHGTSTERYNYLFVLRKDAEGLWKILGWEVSLAEEEE